jgi:hypothetical protein
MDPVQTGFQFASDLAKQLITLSTGILALSITFTKDIVKTLPDRAVRRLKTAWILLLLSILFGIWTMMALTGTLMPIQPSDTRAPLNFGLNVRAPAAAQILAFLGGVVFIISYGGISLRERTRMDPKGE